MKDKTKIVPFIFFLIFVYMGIFPNYRTPLYSSSLFYILTICMFVVSVVRIHKSFITVGKIVRFEAIEDIGIDENVNFKLFIVLPDFNEKQVEVKGLFSRPPQLGKDIKIIVYEPDFSDLEIYTGAELALNYIFLVFFTILFAITLYTYIFIKNIWFF